MSLLLPFTEPANSSQLHLEPKPEPVLETVGPTCPALLSHPTPSCSAPLPHYSPTPYPDTKALIPHSAPATTAPSQLPKYPRYIFFEPLSLPSTWNAAPSIPVRSLSVTGPHLFPPYCDVTGCFLHPVFICLPHQTADSTWVETGVCFAPCCHISMPKTVPGTHRVCCTFVE